MLLKKHQQNFIIKHFHQMETTEDFLALLNYAKSLIYGDKTYPFVLRQVNFYSNPNTNTNRYLSFTVKKKAG